MLGGVLAVLAAPRLVAAHGLTPIYQSPLPLAVYLVGAAAVVALSFVFVLARDVRAGPAVAPQPVAVPAAVRRGLRILGLAGWAWIMAQGIAGGSSDAAVAGLFLWVYGWVGVAMVSALLFPVWEWLDPFATLFDIGAWAVRRLGVRGWAPSGVPERLCGWPAVAGFAFFVWLELVVVPGTSALTLVLALYTLLTLALMAQAGRDAWRGGGETFTVWFRTLNRLAPYGLANHVGGEATVVRRPFASGLLDVSWPVWRIVLVALAVASIIFDGLSQTVAFASVFGTPGVVPKTALLAVFLGLVVGAALGVQRAVSPGAIGAGLLPIAMGYLVAHYLTYVLFDGQRIAIAVSDPLQTGADLLGTAFYQVQTGWLPAGLVWTAQLAAVVAGHMLGAWGGHVTAQREAAASPAGAAGGRGRAPGRPTGPATASPNGRDDRRAKGRDAERTTDRPAGKEPRDMRHRRIHAAAHAGRNVRLREVPLALVMVALSVLTLWSLGQAIVKEPPSSGDVRAGSIRGL